MAQWLGVTPRFRKFYAESSLTNDQITDGETKHRGVRAALNRWYYNLEGDAAKEANSFLIGSWGKAIAVRPPRDVDLYFQLPVTVWQRFENYAGNKQSALLQEVKGVLERTYPQTAMRGDGQVVLVSFNSINVEVVPAFLLQNGSYLICDTNMGGRYKIEDPLAQAQHVEAMDKSCSGNLRRLVKMMKVWQCECNVPLKSFHIELMAIEYMRASEWRDKTYYWFDWLCRDFFHFICTQANGTLTVPGTGEVMLLGDAWHSRALSAYQRSLRACAYEQANQIELAGEEWQKIFGSQIPKIVQGSIL